MSVPVLFGVVGVALLFLYRSAVSEGRSWPSHSQCPRAVCLQWNGSNVQSLAD